MKSGEYYIMLDNLSGRLTVIESFSENVSEIENQSGSLIVTENGEMYYDNTSKNRCRIDDGRNISTPYMFGAKADWDFNIAPDRDGDKSSDDSIAFQNAINSGKSVYVPSGSYKLSKSIMISKDNTHITIDGVVAISAYEGFIIRASNVTIDGNGMILFYGRKSLDDTAIRGSAIVVESYSETDRVIDIMHTMINVRLKRPSGYLIYDYVNYPQYTDNKYLGNEYDCIAIQVRSNNNTSEDAGIFPIIVNSAINNFRTAITIRKSDLYKNIDNVLVKNWCSGLEFNGTIENCLCAIDNETAEGSHIRGAIQPPPIKDEEKRNTYNSPPLVRIPGYTFIDSKLWDLHIMANRYALEIVGDGSIVACTTLQSQYINRPRYGNNVYIINKNADPYSIMQISSYFNSHYFYQYNNILENVVYNPNVHCNFYGENIEDKEASGYTTKWQWGGDGSGGITFKNMFSNVLSGSDFYRKAKNADKIDIKVSIRFDEPQSLKGFAVLGDLLPDEIKFIFYSKNTDSDGNPLVAEITRYANHVDENGNIVGDYDKNLRGGLQYATWEWDWYIASKNPKMWGEYRNTATITGVDIHFITYEISQPVTSMTLIGKISQVFAMTGTPTYLTKNGGNIDGEVSIPTSIIQNSTNKEVLVNKEYVDSLISELQNKINELQNNV